MPTFGRVPVMSTTGAGPPAVAELSPPAAPCGGLVPGAAVPHGAPDFLARLRALELQWLENQMHMLALARRISRDNIEYRRRLEEDLQLSMQLDHLKARL